MIGFSTTKELTRGPMSQSRTAVSSNRSIITNLNRNHLEYSKAQLRVIEAAIPAETSGGVVGSGGRMAGIATIDASSANSGQSVDIRFC